MADVAVGFREEVAVTVTGDSTLEPTINHTKYTDLLFKFTKNKA